VIEAYVYNPRALDGPRSDADAARLRCNYEHTQKIDRSMSSIAQCAGTVDRVIAYRTKPGVWQHLGFCEAHGGLLKAEADLLRIAGEDTIEWAEIP